MDIPGYISSGILESYALGLTSDAEREEVERLAKEFPAIRIEISKIEDAIGKFTTLYHKTPPQALRQQIIKAATSSEPAPKFEPKIIPLRPKPAKVQSSSNTGLKLLVAALFILVAGSGFYNYMQFIQMDGLKVSLAKLQEENTGLAEKITAQNAKMDNMHKDMSLMIKRGNKLIELKGMEKAPTASALIFYNLNTAEVFMSDVNLPVPPAGKQFQLWAYVFGSPVDLGVMNLADSTNDVHAMKNVSNADWFAVTLEPQGGSTVPNAAEMLLSSK